MGVSAGDTVTQALGKVGDSLKNVLDEGKKVAIINEAISKSANQMLPMLEKGTEGLDEFATTAEKLGLIVSDKTLDSFDALGDAFDTINAILNSVGVQLLSGMLPALLAITQALIDTSEKTDSFTEAGKMTGEVILRLAQAFVFLF